MLSSKIEHSVAFLHLADRLNPTEGRKIAVIPAQASLEAKGATPASFQTFEEDS